jgi:hypothetical protein
MYSGFMVRILAFGNASEHSVVAVEKLPPLN